MVFGSKRSCAILQSNYIPWKGYFDLIGLVDEFVFYDSVQYTKNDWRNRNKIKTAQGIQWLTIPVRVESLQQTIRETRVADRSWQVKHWRSISQSYSRAKCFTEFSSVFEEFYLKSNDLSLSAINQHLIRQICNLLEITTKISDVQEYEIYGDKNERIINLCKAVNAEIYVSGAAGKDYLQINRFKDAGIDVRWMDYSGYPEYTQLYGPFEHGVSIFDLLLNQGRDAKNYLKFIGASKNSSSGRA